ncbi:MAG: hypothetical protein IT548_18930 [Alphaproteobacteria bacterium]|nr:hypothetical protein [Alphaproteobacteria bacterium]
MKSELTISVTDFKAKCLNLIERISSGEIGRIAVTKRGEIIAEVTAHKAEKPVRPRLYGSLRGRAAVPPSVDLTEPTTLEATHAEQGIVTIGENGVGLGVDGTPVGYVRTDLPYERRSHPGRSPSRRRTSRG